MQCRDLRELADSFLTEQLLVETNHELVRHLETCPDCRADIASRRALRDRLRRALNTSEELRPRADFASDLAARLRPGPSVMSRRSLLQSWWTLAAGLVLAVGGGVLVRETRSRSRLALLARAASGDHQNCAVKFNLAEHPISLEEAGRRYGAPYGALATFNVSSADAAIQPLERHACVYQGRRFGHVVVRYQGALVSLLVTDGEPPAGAELEPHEHGAQVASLPAGRFVGFVVADLDRERVLHLAQSLAVPLSRHLA
jgi:anti-sigma factor RsiW